MDSMLADIYDIVYEIKNEAQARGLPEVMDECDRLVERTLLDLEGAIVDALGEDATF